jgi:hypothetical protein
MEQTGFDALDRTVRLLEDDQLGSGDPARNFAERLGAISRLHRDAAGDPPAFGRALAAHFERRGMIGEDSGRHLAKQQKFVLDCFFGHEAKESMI